MSARALPACTFALATEQTAAAGHDAPQGSDAEIQFREDLWHEYQREALAASLSAAQATEYASALSSAKGQIEGASEMAPAGRNWFYQSRAVVVRRTIFAGLVGSAHWGRRMATGQTGAAGASRLARRFRWWTAGSEKAKG
jgi:hypothetical protein